MVVMMMNLMIMNLMMMMKLWPGRGIEQHVSSESGFNAATVSIPDMHLAIYGK